MHFLALMGAGMLGYAMYINALMPTGQFILCVAVVIHGVAQRPRGYDTTEPAAAAVSAPGPKAAKAQAESRKKK